MIGRVLVTGGAGFIGSALVRRLLDSRPGVSVVTLDALTYCGNPENLEAFAAHPRHRFVHGDVCDAGLVRGVVGEVDAVLHAAAESHVDRSIADASPFVRTNVVGTQTLLDAVRASGRAVRVVHVGTDEVYGALPLGDGAGRFTEESPLAPNSPYAASKAAADMLCRAAHRTHGVDVVVTRSANNMGPRQFPEKLVPLFVSRLLRGEKVPLYGDGLHVRDWVHVDDHADGVIAAMERGAAGGVYNISAGVEVSNLALTRAMLAALGLDESRIEHVADRPGHDRRYAADAVRARRELGWAATRSVWPGMLHETVAWYAANPGWTERALARGGARGAARGLTRG